MKRFWRTISCVFHKYLLWSVIAYVVLMSPFYYIYSFVGTPEKIKEPATTYSYIILLCYGLSRVWRFHPIFNATYLMQLALSPWNCKHSLPKGPVHLFWADAVVVGFIMLLSLFFPVNDWPALPFIFLIGYNAGLFLSFCMTNQIRFIVLYLLIIPLIAYPHDNGFIAALVVLLITAIGLYGIRCYFIKFPWNTSWWTGNQVELLKREAIGRRVIQWPFCDLRTSSLFSGGAAFALMMGALVFWYIHPIDRLSHMSGEDYISNTYYG